MAKQHRKFSVEPKLQSIQEAEKNGITLTLHKHNIVHSLYRRCISKLSRD